MNSVSCNPPVDEDLKRGVAEFDVTIPEFEMLRLNKQYQKYIALEEGKIRFNVYAPTWRIALSLDE